ncbi:MAG: tetratricopeptide repeat protein [bacterium]|nr:tetratricopeptide repeat protein [bacterium]
MKKVVILKIVFCFCLLTSFGCIKKQYINKEQPSSDLVQAKENQHTNPIALSYVMQAAIAEASMDFYKAIALYKTAIDYDPHSLTILQALTELYLKVNELSPARIHIMRALKLEPNNLKSWKLFINTVLLQNDFQSLSAMLDRWSRNEDLTEDHYHLLVETYSLMGNFKKASELVFLTGERLGWNYLKKEKYGSLLFLLKDYKQAKEIFQKCIQEYPNEPNSYFLLGKLALNENDTLYALRLFQNYINLKKNDPMVWLEIIEIHYNLAKDEIADSLLQSALNYFPDNVFILSRDAKRWLQRKNYEKAIEQSHKILQIDSTFITSYIDLAFIYHEINDYANAEKIYEKAYQIDSTDALLLNNYAYLLATQKRNLEKALVMVNQALESDSFNVSYIDTKAWILFQMGQFHDALQEIEKIIHQISLSDEALSYEIWDHYGDILAALERKDEAIKAWSRALELAPENNQLKNKINQVEK